MKVLIIEDSDYKIQSIQGLLKGLALDENIRVAKAFQSGKRALKEFRPDLVLLDMTLPTSESPDGRLEGRMRIFGGRELLAEMEFLDITSKVIIVTQFDHFGEPPYAVDLMTLLDQLKFKYPNFFLGGVYYSNIDSKWQSELSSILANYKA